MGNPKVMVFYLALLPALIDTARVTVVGYAELVAVTLGVLAIVFTGYVVLASRRPPALHLAAGAQGSSTAAPAP